MKRKSYIDEQTGDIILYDVSFPGFGSKWTVSKDFILEEAGRKGKSYQIEIASVEHINFTVYNNDVSFGSIAILFKRKGLFGKNFSSVNFDLKDIAFAQQVCDHITKVSGIQAMVEGAITDNGAEDEEVLCRGCGALVVGNQKFCEYCGVEVRH